MNPQVILRERYPRADFSVYFRHLAACRTVKALNTQEHHICPRKQFPEFIDSPENKIILKTDDHAFAHKLLEALCGIKSPPTTYFESARDAAAKGGRVSGPRSAVKCLARGTGIFATGARAKGGRKNVLSGHLAIISAKVRTSEHQAHAAHFAGVAVQKIHKKNGTGCFSRAHQAAASAGSNHIRWHVNRNIVSPTCSLCGAL